MQISIVIVNYNTRDLILSCLDSFYPDIDRSRAEVIVVDNASLDNSAAMIQLKFPSIQLVVNKSNSGFAAANNVGIKRSKGKYILLLNSDTIMRTNVLERMYEYMEANPKVGIAGCMLLNADGSLQPSITNFPRVRNDLVRVFFRLDPLRNTDKIRGLINQYLPFLIGQGLGRFADHNKEQEVECVMGAFLFVRRGAVDEVGLLDEGFFFLVEEADWALRFKSLGWRVMYVPAVSIIHLGGATSEQEFPRRRFVQMYKSRLYYHVKHKGVLSVLIYRCGIALAMILRLLFLSLNMNLGKVKNQEETRSKIRVYKLIARMMFDSRLRSRNIFTEPILNPPQ